MAPYVDGAGTPEKGRQGQAQVGLRWHCKEDNCEEVQETSK